MTAISERVAELLRTLNPSDPSGQWSLYDLGRKLPDVPAKDISAAVAEFCPHGGRYVGGTSEYLYHL